MPKQSQVLDIEPKNEICFKGPFTTTVTEYFKLTNPTNKKIAFKVKTTAPKRYCVRPNNGVINPGTSVSIAVMLQATDGTIADKNKHKFMIQSVEAPDGDFNHEELFKSVDPNSIMDSKFKCVFDDPNEEKSVNGNPNGDNIGGGSDNGENELHRTEAGRFGSVVGMSKASNQQQQPIDAGRFSTAVSEVESRKNDKDDEQSGEELKDNFSNDLRLKPKAKEDNLSESEGQFESLTNINKPTFPASQASSSQRTQTNAGSSGAYLRSNVPTINSAGNFSSNIPAFPKPAGFESNDLSLMESPHFVYLVGGIFAALVIGFILGKIF